MTFVVALIALLIERFFDWSHLRHWQWCTKLQRQLIQRFSHLSSYMMLVFTLLPLIIIVALMNVIIQGWLYGVVKLLFHLFVLLYCFGPRNLWADSFAAISALAQGDKSMVEEKLKTAFNLVNFKPANLHSQLLDQIFTAANHRVFAVLFWYAILGPMGAVLYRSVSLTAETSTYDAPSDLPKTSFLIEEILDWFPVRIMTGVFALSGHFVQVFNCLRHTFLLPPLENHRILFECGIAALGYDSESIPMDGAAEKNTIHLLDRTFIIILVLLAILFLLI